MKLFSNNTRNLKKNKIICNIYIQASKNSLASYFSVAFPKDWQYCHIEWRCLFAVLNKGFPFGQKSVDQLIS